MRWRLRFRTATYLSRRFKTNVDRFDADGGDAGIVLEPGGCTISMLESNAPYEMPCIPLQPAAKQLAQGLNWAVPFSEQAENIYQSCASKLRHYERGSRGVSRYGRVDKDHCIRLNHFLYWRYCGRGEGYSGEN